MQLKVKMNDLLKDTRAFDIRQGMDLLRSGGFVTMSWGISLITNLTIKGEDRGMMFNVNGYKFQGSIIMSVNFMDLYDIRFMDKGEIVHEITDVYVSDAIRLIDEYVEKQPEYKY